MAPASAICSVRSHIRLAQQQTCFSSQAADTGSNHCYDRPARVHSLNFLRRPPVSSIGRVCCPLTSNLPKNSRRSRKVITKANADLQLGPELVGPEVNDPAFAGPSHSPQVQQDFQPLPKPTSTELHPTPKSLGWLHKLLPLGLMYMCACFTNTIVDLLKDAVVVTSCGAEVLPYLSALCVLPASVAVICYHGWLARTLPRKYVYHATIAPFIGIYILFAAVLYPNHAALHLNLCSGQFFSALPEGLKPLLTLVSNWPFALFFTICELWGPVAISIGFFGTANDVLSIKEAAVVYPLVGIIANFAVIGAGLFSSVVLKQVAGSNMQLSLTYLIGSCVVATAVMCGCKIRLEHQSSQTNLPASSSALPSKYASSTSQKASSSSTANESPTRGKQDMRSALGIVTSSRQVYNLFLFVASYGLCHKLFEISWKDQLRTVFPTASDYQSVLSDVQTAVGVTTLVFMFLARFIFAHLGWSVAAAATPVMMLLCGSLFFSLSLASQHSSALPWLPVGGSQLARFGALAGNMTEVASRSTRYSLLEPAKEMKYMEWSTEQRAQGKAAIDLLASTLGKSGASWLIQGLVFACGSLNRSMPVIGVMFVGIIVAWLGSVGNLRSKTVEQKAAERRELVLAAA